MPISSSNTVNKAAALSQQDSVFRSAGVVSVSVLTSRVSGLIREILMARLFGAGLVYDAFLAGFRIPNLTRDLFAEGALSSAFVPTFTHYLTTKNKREAAVLANLVGTAIILVVGTLCLLGIVFSPALVSLTVPGFSTVPGKIELTVHLTRIMFPFLLMVALAAQAMGMLNACNQFTVPAHVVYLLQHRLDGFRHRAGVLGGAAAGLRPHRRHGLRRGAGRRYCNSSGSCRASIVPGSSSASRPTGRTPACSRSSG